MPISTSPPPPIVKVNSPILVAVVNLVLEAIRYLNDLRWVTILDDDQVVMLTKWPPHLQEIQFDRRGSCGIKVVERERGRYEERDARKIEDEDDFGEKRESYKRV